MAGETVKGKNMVKTLYVDLDGTLVTSDTLLESILPPVKRAPASPFYITVLANKRPSII